MLYVDRVVLCHSHTTGQRSAGSGGERQVSASTISYIFACISLLFFLSLTCSWTSVFLLKGFPKFSPILFRTLYIEGERKLDFAGWCAAIRSAGRSGGDTLSQQQLTETDIPVIVHSCIGYITQCGESPTNMCFNAK